MAFVDSVSTRPNKPLFEVVREKIDAWRAINTSPFILDWIQNGVYIPLAAEPFNFHHKNAELPPDQLEYWYSKLQPHYLATGAI